MGPAPQPLFEEIPRQVLDDIAQSSVRLPKLYRYPLRFVRKFFWARLRRIQKDILANAPSRDVALDFGCGSGVFLPTLCRMFRLVQGIDIEAQEAAAIAERFGLSNLRLISMDINRDSGSEVMAADVIVAADVLEHFKDLAAPVRCLRVWLKDDGYLFTSGPMENFYTWAGRKLGRMEKPWDHYHTGFQVEDYLATSGFVRIASCYVRWWMPMYVVSVWRKRGCN